MVSKPLTELFEQLQLPAGRIVLLHVRLKGLLEAAGGSYKAIEYGDLSADLIEVFRELYVPSGILVPTFSYSFTQTAIYDRTRTPGEVGRFGEEIRKAYPHSFRSMNPVFSVIDCDSLFDKNGLDEGSAFGVDSLWERLDKRGHISVNVNLQEPIVSTYLHFLEYAEQVPYRYEKMFAGRVSEDGLHWNDVFYEYHVRDLETDTTWRREKIAKFLIAEGVFHDVKQQGVTLRWFDSLILGPLVKSALQSDPYFFIKD